MFYDLQHGPGAEHTVLIIDPDFDNRKVAATMLASRGFEILEATDPGEGVRIARRTGPCVIVTELFERTECGWRILDSLRQFPETSGIPIIAFTAHALSADKEAALGAGATLFLAKPLPPQELDTAVEELLEVGERPPSA